MGWNQIWLAQPKAAESPPKIAAKQVNIDVSLMALRSCNVVVTKPSAHSTIHYIEKQTNQATRFLRPSILLAPCESKESLAKTFWIITDFPLTESHSWVSRDKCILYQLFPQTKNIFLVNGWITNLSRNCSSRIREDEKCRIPGRKEQTLNRHYLARIKSGTTQFLGARKCKILGESFLTMYI